MDRWSITPSAPLWGSALPHSQYEALELPRQSSWVPACQVFMSLAGRSDADPPRGWTGTGAPWSGEGWALDCGVGVSCKSGKPGWCLVKGRPQGAGLQRWGDLVTWEGLVLHWGAPSGRGRSWVCGRLSVGGSWKPVPKEFTGDRNFSMLGRGVSEMWRKVDF